MTDRSDRSPWLKLIGSLFVSATLAFSPAVFAQEDSDEDDAAEEEEATEEIVVTGSRLKRDTFTSTSPLQIITGQVSREVGLIDAADILQESTAASGQQIDLTFNGFVLDDGPGQTNIDLRGLGGARTLVLINGRRLAPAGVEGAPTTPDLGLIPASLVQQYDILLDGASSIYGSDAVAGVANVIMRKDFDGLEVEGFASLPEQDGGDATTFSVAWGKNFDRGFFGIGAEIVQNDKVTLDQRSWTEGCLKHAEIDENGEIRTAEQFYPTVYGMQWDECAGGPDVFTIFAGNGFNESMFYTANTTNAGVPNWSDWSEFVILDADADGQPDVNFRDYSTVDDQQFAHLFSEREQQSFMAYGEYTLEGEMNLTPYFEVLYSKRETFINSGAAPLFPSVPANNPYNPCNPNGVRGVDCGLAQNELYSNPNIEDDFRQAFNFGFGATYDVICQTFGIDPCLPINVFGPTAATGPIPSPQHIVYVRNDRNLTDVEIDQTRAVFGVRGDLPMLDFGDLTNWSFDLYGSFSTSDGSSSRLGVRGDRLDVALGYYSTTESPCQVDDLSAFGPNGGIVGSDLADDAVTGCVPVDLFAPSLFPSPDNFVNGEFATTAERNYLFDSRDFDTGYEQMIFSGYMTGELFQMPAGAASLGFGIEWRDDDIQSNPDQVAADGLFFGFFVDGGAVGQRETLEYFTELELPLLAGAQAAEELTLNLSARYTDDEYYGGEWTESVKMAWRPVDHLLIRGTYGSSYRAPNLRNLFLRDQTGFNTIFDPCYIPLIAYDDDEDLYIPENDTRDQNVLDNCRAQGVDPTLANLNGTQTYGTELREGGSLTLDPETSESWTAGFAWEMPVNAFDLAIGATYYEIDIVDSIIEPSAAFIIGDCYNSVTGNSTFCDRLTRDFSDPTDPRIVFIDQGFINRDKESARGVDLNVTLQDTLTIAQRPIDLTVDVRANRQLERSTLFVNPDGEVDFNAFQGEFGFPTWKGQAQFRLDYSDWRFTWETGYIGSQAQDLEGVDEFSDINGIGDTCLGPGAGDVLCRDIGYASNYFRHSMSVYYFGDTWTVGGGVRNVFEEAPPFVDGTEVSSINNTPIGYGYDLNGRTFFFNLSAQFGGGS